jgi:hypothetical protein
MLVVDGLQQLRMVFAGAKVVQVHKPALPQVLDRAADIHAARRVAVYLVDPTHRAFRPDFGARQRRGRLGRLRCGRSAFNWRNRHLCIDLGK